MNHSLRKSWVPVLATLALAGCYEDKQMVLDLSTENSAFYDQGFPSDLRITADGHINMAHTPQAANITVQNYRKVVEKNDSGFAPQMPLYMRFSGDISPDDLSISNDPSSYTNNHASIQLIDIDPNSNERGRRFPIQVSYREKGDEYRPDGLLQVLPVGQYLKEDTTYALIVKRSISPEHHKKLIVNPVLSKLLQDKNPRDANRKISHSMANKAQAVYQPLVNQIKREGIHTDSIIGATVWTTGKPGDKLQNLVDSVIGWQTPSANSELTLLKETDDFCILQSSWTAPGLQKGNLPYAMPWEGGEIQYDKQGQPIVQYDRNSPFIITIPKMTMPASGFPMMFYHHGTGGLATQVFERGYSNKDGLTPAGSPAEVAAIRGWAASGMAGHLGGDHKELVPLYDFLGDVLKLDLLSITAYNSINIKAMRDNYLQMVAEQTLFRRLVNDLSIDASLCPGAQASNGHFFFNTNMQAVNGQSLGAMTAAGVAATDPMGYQALIASGAGSYDLGLVMRLAKLPGQKPMGNILEPVLFFTGVNDIVNDPFHPVWAISNLALAPADFTYNAARWQRDNSNPIPAPHTLIVEGHFDDWVTNPSQISLLRALETDFVGDELNVPTKDQLLPSLLTAGNQQVDAPMSDNKDNRTIAVVRYAEDGIKSGHNVMFQYEAPKHQVGCFLQDTAAGMIPSVIAGGNIANSCISGPAVKGNN